MKHFFYRMIIKTNRACKLNDGNICVFFMENQLLDQKETVVAMLSLDLILIYRRLFLLEEKISQLVNKS